MLACDAADPATRVHYRVHRTPRAPRNLRTLAARFACDPDVRIVSAGAGATRGTATFYPSPDCARSTFAIDTMRHLGDGCAFERGNDTAIATFDDLIAEFGRPAFIKLTWKALSDRCSRVVASRARALLRISR